MMHLAEKDPAGTFLPKDVRKKAEVVSWLMFQMVPTPFHVTLRSCSCCLKQRKALHMASVHTVGFDKSLGHVITLPCALCLPQLIAMHELARLQVTHHRAELLATCHGVVPALLCGMALHTFERQQ